MRFFFILITFLTAICSCDQTSNHISTASYKDSVLKAHIQYLEISDEFDTTEVNYKVLKAYLKNDTAYFRELREDIEEDKKLRKQWSMFDSCIHLPKIHELDVDKAYRFIYSAAFCPYKISITISKNYDTFNLHFILYQFKWDTASCRIITEYNRPISNKNWNEFADAMQVADFWGLKKQNGFHGLDGDDLKVWGFENGDTALGRPSRFSYVERWLVAKSSLADPFQLLLKFSGNKRGCLWAQ